MYAQQTTWPLTNGIAPTTVINSMSHASTVWPAHTDAAFGTTLEISHEKMFLTRNTAGLDYTPSAKYSIFSSG